MVNLGQAGESLVAAWLEQQGWRIVEKRWRVKQGEIDLIAHNHPTVHLGFCGGKDPQWRQLG